jgi:3-hydroxybutyryl-CoA dehydrogenase
MAIQRAGVVGGGVSGRGIARSLASVGIDVTLVEASASALEQSLAALRDGMQRDIARWALTEGERDLVLGRIRGVSTIRALAGCGIVFESIQEDFRAKVDLLQELDRVLTPAVPILSNSSTISLTDLSATLPPDRRGWLVGLHFHHPVTRVEAVELVAGRNTLPQAMGAAREVASLLGKEVIEVAESPGYVSSRLTLSLINEAIQLLLEGVATRDAIDRSMKLRFGSRMGPLALADEMGLDSVLRSMESLRAELDLPHFRPSPLLRRMVARGWLGEKTGRGFYRYDPTGGRIDEPENLDVPSLESLLDRGGAAPRPPDAPAGEGG